MHNTLEDGMLPLFIGQAPRSRRTDSRKRFGRIGTVMRPAAKSNGWSKGVHRELSGTPRSGQSPKRALPGQPAQQAALLAFHDAPELGPRIVVAAQVERS